MNKFYFISGNSPAWISINKPSSMSSVYNLLNAPACNDGNYNSECHTEQTFAKQPQFVMVNLEERHWIDFIQVIIVAGLSHRFQNVRISLYDDVTTFQGSGQCDHIVTEPNWLTFPAAGSSLYNSTSCSNVVGQYVRIEMEGLHADAYLHMFELMVYGRSIFPAFFIDVSYCCFSNID